MLPVFGAKGHSWRVFGYAETQDGKTQYVQAFYTRGLRTCRESENRFDTPSELEEALQKAEVVGNKVVRFRHPRDLPKDAVRVPFGELRVT